MARRVGIPHVAALDGLRGVAVAGVLMFHGGHLAGGYLAARSSRRLRQRDPARCRTRECGTDRRFVSYTCPGGTCPDKVDGVRLRPDGLRYEGPGARKVSQWILG